jgi:hypothetical protein
LNIRFVCHVEPTSDHHVENPCRKAGSLFSQQQVPEMDSLYLLPSEMGGENVTEKTDLDIIPVFKTVLAYPHNDSLQFNDIFNMSWGRKFDTCISWILTNI